MSSIPIKEMGLSYAWARVKSLVDILDSYYIWAKDNNASVNAYAEEQGKVAYIVHSWFQALYFAVYTEAWFNNYNSTISVGIIPELEKINMKPLSEVLEIDRIKYLFDLYELTYDTNSKIRGLQWNQGSIQLVGLGISPAELMRPYFKELEVKKRMRPNK